MGDMATAGAVSRGVDAGIPVADAREGRTARRRTSVAGAVAGATTLRDWSDTSVRASVRVTRPEALYGPSAAPVTGLATSGRDGTCGTPLLSPPRTAGPGEPCGTADVAGRGAGAEAVPAEATTGSAAADAAAAAVATAGAGGGGAGAVAAPPAEAGETTGAGAAEADGEDVDGEDTGSGAGGTAAAEAEPVGAPGVATGAGAGAGVRSGAEDGLGGGGAASRGGRSVAGSRYPSAAVETRIPRWT
jgi:hypothetical protein